jgi:hypothetical protein
MPSKKSPKVGIVIKAEFLYFSNINNEELIKIVAQ